MRWTMDDIKNKNFHVNNGVGMKITNMCGIKPKKVKVAKKTPDSKNFIEFVLINLKVDYQKEFRFDEVRMFKFDFAIPHLKIAIEYEGLVFNSNKATSTGKSGHTTVTGYTSNCGKYNLAIIKGWRVLRYTALNYKESFNDLEFLLKVK